MKLNRAEATMVRKALKELLKTSNYSETTFVIKNHCKSGIGRTTYVVEIDSSGEEVSDRIDCTDYGVW
jgi:protein tyrosine phosphatase